jgi:hypothetical protein
MKVAYTPRGLGRWQVTRADITELFKRLRQVGLFARQDYWCCNSCGCSALTDDMRSKHVGWAFYHHQDMQSAFNSDTWDMDFLQRPLYLTYGDPKGKGEDTIAVGNMIVAIMSELGLQTEWDGNPNKRIAILPTGVVS